VLKPQWWVNCKPLAEEAIRRTKAGELLITPKQSENDWYRWLEGIQDWCISRQLWWGHRCPAYFVRIEGVAEQDTGDDKHWVVGRTAEEARARAEVLAQGRKFVLEQDEDVLDTWFSSGLWPFSILGWPDQVRFLFLPMDRWLTGFKRHPILRNSTHQVCSKQDGTFSSSGSHGWYC
jgi:valyl-tRNA synthetase